MSLSKPFRFENNRTQNPWIASTIIGKENSKFKPQTVKVLKHVRGPLDDGSMVREVTDGELYITTVFSKESILKFYTQLDECTPPEWTNALLILKKFHIDYQPNKTFEKSEYVLFVEYFILWDLQQGFERKNALIYCMEDVRIKEKAKEIWKLKQMEENDTMDSIPLTQLLEQMEEDDSQVEGCVTGTKSEETTERPKLTPQEQLTKSFKVGEFLIDLKQEDLLNRIKEWQVDYKPSLSDEDSSVNTPELNPAQPTLIDHEENKEVKDKSAQNRREKDYITESQHKIVGDVNENVFTNVSHTCSNQEKENLDETDELLVQIGQDSIRKSSTDSQSEKTNISDTSNIINENTASNLKSKEINKLIIASDTNNSVEMQLTNTCRVVQNSDMEVLDNSSNSDPLVPQDSKGTSKNKNVCHSDIGLNTENVISADVDILQQNEIRSGENNYNLASNFTPDSGPFNVFPDTQEFTPALPSSDEDNQLIVTSSQEVLSNNSVKSKLPISPSDIQTQEFVPHCLSEDLTDNQVFCSSPRSPDSTSGIQNETPPLFEDSHEKMAIDCSEKVNSQSESSEENIKFMALPIGKVTRKTDSDKGILLEEKGKISNRGDMPCKSKYRLSDDEIMQECEEKEKLNLLTLSGGGDAHLNGQSFKHDSLSISEKLSDRQNGKCKSRKDDAVVSENDSRVKRRKIVSAFEEQINEISDKNNDSNHSDVDTKNNETDCNTSDIRTDNDDNDDSVHSHSFSRLRTVFNKVLDVIGLTPRKVPPKSEYQENNSDVVTRQLGSDTGQGISSDIDSEELIVLSSTSEDIDQSGEEILTLNSGDSGQKEKSTSDSPDISLAQIIEDSDKTVSPDISVDKEETESRQQTERKNLKVDDRFCWLLASIETTVVDEEVFASLIEMDPPTEIGQKLLDLKLPSDMVDKIGQYYLKM